MDCALGVVAGKFFAQPEMADFLFSSKNMHAFICIISPITYKTVLMLPSFTDEETEVSLAQGHPARKWES